MHIREEYYHRDAKIEYQGKTYQLEESDFKELVSSWIGQNDPSTWAACEIVVHIHAKWKELPRAKVLELASLLLGKTVEELEGMMEWNAQYMAWHDGGVPEEQHVYPSTEQ